MSQFTGIFVPLITPFDIQGAVDLRSLGQLVRSLLKAQVAGFVVGGTTGEPATQTEAEKESVLQCVLDAAAAHPIIVGASGIAPADVIEQIEKWNRYPIAGLLVTAPYYVRPSQDGLIQFFKSIAKAAAHPILIYDIPYRTGVQIELQTLRTLAQIPNIRGVKDCGGDPRKTQALIADGELDILCGDDHSIFTTLCQGGPGVIAASAHLHPALFVRMLDAVRAQDLVEARQLHHALSPLIYSLFAEPSPGALKAVLAHLGCIDPDLRLPMTQPSHGAASAALAAYEAVLKSPG